MTSHSGPQNKATSFRNVKLEYFNNSSELFR